MIFALRTDKAFDAVKAWVERQGFGGFAVRETAAGDNEHWHWLLDTPKTIKQIRNSLLHRTSGVPELSGNGAYSLTECRDQAKYERYMVKGNSEGEGYELAWRNNIVYTDEKLEELHAAYWEANRKMRKRAAGSIVDRVVDICKQQNVQWNERSKIAKIYISEQVACSKPFSTFTAKSVVNVVECLLCPDDQAVNNFAESI